MRTALFVEIPGFHSSAKFAGSMERHASAPAERRLARKTAEKKSSRALAYDFSIQHFKFIVLPEFYCVPPSESNGFNNVLPNNIAFARGR